MLFAWLTICLLFLIWICAFVAVAACAPILLSARRERCFRRLRRSFSKACQTVWWAGAPPTVIRLRHRAPSARAAHMARSHRRRAA